MRKMIVWIMFMSVMLSASVALAKDVFVTKEGKRYHSETCRLIKSKNASAVEEKQAQEKGLTPCSRCLGKTESPKDGK